MSGLALPAQLVDATQALNLSAGVSKGLTWSFVYLTSHERAKRRLADEYDAA